MPLVLGDGAKSSPHSSWASIAIILPCAKQFFRAENHWTTRDSTEVFDKRSNSLIAISKIKTFRSSLPTDCWTEQKGITSPWISQTTLIRRTFGMNNLVSTVQFPELKQTCGRISAQFTTAVWAGWSDWGSTSFIVALQMLWAFMEQKILLTGTCA